MTGVPTRVRWALEVVDPAPDEQLLEIGCGPGVAADLVCDRLTTGRLLAIDRSATAVDRAARRNERHLASGRLDLRQCELGALSTPAGSLDQAFAVDVNVFWTTSPEAELGVLRQALRPGGHLHLLYGTGPADAARVGRRIAEALAAAHFDDVVVLDASAGFGLSARRS